jgi:hypothetical protein
MRLAPATRRHTERAAYHRAADLAKSHADHWEREARAHIDDAESAFSAGLKAGHWRIIEKEIRGLARQREADHA